MNNTTMKREGEFPGPEMLFKVPEYRDTYTRITIAICFSIICSLIVVLFEKNKYLSKYFKYLNIDEIVYIIVGFTMAEVSCNASWFSQKIDNFLPRLRCCLTWTRN